MQIKYFFFLLFCSIFINLCVLHNYFFTTKKTWKFVRMTKKLTRNLKKMYSGDDEIKKQKLKDVNDMKRLIHSKT